VTVVEARARAATVKKNIAKRNKKQQPVTTEEPASLTFREGVLVEGVVPISNESLVWDNSRENLVGETDPSRLWSTSTQFSVEVLSLTTEPSQQLGVSTAEMAEIQSMETEPRSSPDALSTASSTGTVRQNIPEDGVQVTDDHRNNDNTGSAPTYGGAERRR
jgi:hypothetical protein